LAAPHTAEELFFYTRLLLRIFDAALLTIVLTTVGTLLRYNAIRFTLLTSFLMRLVTYTYKGKERLGFVCQETMLDAELGYDAAKHSIHAALPAMPNNILDFLRLGDKAVHEAHKLLAWYNAPHHSPIHAPAIVSAYEATLLSPVPRPVSVRDGYAFRQHVETARRNRGLEMIPVFDEIPIFYFTNHLAITGEGVVQVQDQHLQQLDFELEVAIVIGKEGKNIPAHKADEHIFGMMVMNDWSARALQMQEMQMNLGPAKGKDFATSLGPCLVTMDELAKHRRDTQHGAHYDLTMTARINGQEVSRGNVGDMRWTFAQIIERASYGVTLYPGEVIGSGTCGTGCLLELNGSKVFDPPRWLNDGDTVECEIEGLGVLSNRITKA
jgi:fumarylacetoacetate (FAA) hydrolase